VENFNPRWNGDLLVASLKASSLYRLRLEQGRVLYSEPIWIGQRIRDIAQLDDGKIVLWTDDTQLLFIDVDEDLLKQGRRAPNIVSATLGNHCMYCHHLVPTHPGDPAPSLSNVIGRPIASDNFPYSEGLRGVHGVWTADALSRFLADPGKFASGTNMPDLRLSPDTIKKVVTDLNFAEPQQATIVSSRAH
jgi:cytochrome c2